MISALTTGRALNAEWIKIRSLRSTWIAAAIATVVTVLISELIYRSAANSWATYPPRERAAFDPVRTGYASAFVLAVLALGTLGTLTASSEYGTGLIRTTFTATPRRRHVVTAKIIVVGGLALALGETASFTIFALGQHTIAGTGASVPLTHPGVARAVVGSGVFLAVIALVGLALGFLIRSTAGAVAAVVGLYFVAPVLLGSISDTLSKLALESAFSGVVTTVPRPDHVQPSAPTAFLILAGYVVVGLGAAVVAVHRRDA